MVTLFPNLSSHNYIWVTLEEYAQNPISSGIVDLRNHVLSDPNFYYASWWHANQYCSKVYGTHLASYRHVNDFAALRQCIPDTKRFYIGLTRQWWTYDDENHNSSIDENHWGFYDGSERLSDAKDTNYCDNNVRYRFGHCFDNVSYTVCN